jgi:nucleoside-diphosphate-sugar epimerase
MKLFVTGATGVLGWRAVEQLVAAGHAVTGVARGPDKATRVERLGATPVTVDLFDPAALAEAVRDHEVVCNLATRIPRASSALLPGAWTDNDRIRREVSRNLVDAALATDVQRYVQESIAFMYPDGGDAWIDESTPLDVTSYARTVVDAEAQAQRFTDAGRTGVVLRFGMFYGPDSTHTIDSVRMVRRRVAPAVAPLDAYMSSITTHDAGCAVPAALRAPAGVYNVVEDEPCRGRDYFDALANALGVGRPRWSTVAMAKLARSKTAALRRSQRVSNRRFKDATGWTPDFPSVCEGWPAVIEEMRKEEAERA